MSEMEPEVKQFLKKVVWTLSGAMVWLTLNMYLGIYKEMAFPETKVTAWNIFFYCFSASTLAALIFYFFRLWKQENL